MMPLNEKKHERKRLLVPVHNAQKVSRVVLCEIL